MSTIEAITKFIIGGSLVLLINIIGKTKYSYLSGVIVLFPVITAIGYYYLSFTTPPHELKKIILLSMISIPTIIAFLSTLYFTVEKFNIVISLSLSITIWCITALVFVTLRNKLIL